MSDQRSTTERLRDAVRALIAGFSQVAGITPRPIHSSLDDQLRRVDERLQRTLRPDLGACPGCEATVLEWCRPGCALIDPMDYR